MIQSKIIWYRVKWKIIDRASPYNPITKRCNLCNKERFYIMYKRNMATLNKRKEVYTVCRHRLKTLLSKSWSLNFQNSKFTNNLYYLFIYLFIYSWGWNPWIMGGSRSSHYSWGPHLTANFSKFTCQNPS